jgi:uncharacterized membrane protein YbhN (UPF0104 family)
VSPERRSSPLARWGFRAATVAVSVLILYWALYGISYQELREKTLHANLRLAVFGAVAPLFVFWITDALFTVRSFAWCGRPVPFKSYLVIKAVAYLLNMVNIVFSTGGVFLYFLKKTGISARAQAGLLLWRLEMDALGMIIFYAAIIGAALGLAPAQAAKMQLPFTLPVLLVSLLIGVEWALYWLKGGGLMMKRLPVNFQAEFWMAFRMLGPRHWGKGMAYTFPPLVANFVGMYLCARAFHLDVPLLYFLFWIPLVALFSALPIAFGGFGTTTAAWFHFFAHYGAHSEIAAVTIFIPAVRLVTRGLFGIVFMPFATREIESLTEKSEK